MWNPDAYLAFADQRGRPFFDLLARVGAQSPRRVVDLGCGPGNLTVHLQQRWPSAAVEAIDSSAEMVAAARKRGIDAVVGGIEGWSPGPDTDVVVANAALHWVPGHAEQMIRWAHELDAGGWIAVQVPGNFDSPSHQLAREVAQRAWFADLLGDRPLQDITSIKTPSGYAEILSDAGCEVDTWETSYLHQLTGETPVLDWITGSALTPAKERLTEEVWQQYRTELAPLLAAAYPARPDGTTLFPFRRVFAVAHVR